MVYNYTKPRGPIAAMYSSPGPIYSLPSLIGSNQHDPRSTHDKRPAWIFGSRYGNLRSECGPGPAYNPDPKMLKSGRDGIPSFSIYPRLQDGKQFETPAPCTYSIDSTTDYVLKRAPAYVFGQRFAGRRYDDIPAPIKYSLDPMVGRTVRSDKKSNPSYTITGRSKVGGFGEDLQKTPGPGTYGVTAPQKYKNKMPEYTLGARNELPGDNTKKPGPSAYSPRLGQAIKAAPEFSFGIRHSQYKGEYITEADTE